VFQRQQALDWLRTVIDDGRSTLHSQHAPEGKSKLGICPAG
jgi:hypothetical protein